MNIGQRIKEARERKGLTQEELGKFCNSTKQTIYKYETGIVTNIPTDKIEQIADALNVLPQYLTGWEKKNPNWDIPNLMPPPKLHAVPRIGSIACGEPILAQENIEGEDMVPENIECDFTLRCKGNSMINAHIHDGDIVCIKEQPEVENGQIAAVLIDGLETEATLKRFRKTGDTIILMPENPDYEPMVFTGKEMNRVHIVGLAVYYIAKVR